MKELIKGNDGLARAVKIQTSTGEITRPIVKLFPLEVNDTVKTSSDDTMQTDDQTTEKPQRLASTRARDTIRKWIKRL